MNTTKEVIVDGVRYVPAREVVINREQLLRGLVDIVWGKGTVEDLAWFEEQASELFIDITEEETDYNQSILQFVDELAL